MNLLINSEQHSCSPTMVPAAFNKQVLTLDFAMQSFSFGPSNIPLSFVAIFKNIDKRRFKLWE